MSDTWYRGSVDLPPYEINGDLWTWDGICLNPIHTCEPPAWYVELQWTDMIAELIMSSNERTAGIISSIPVASPGTPKALGIVTALKNLWEQNGSSRPGTGWSNPD